MDFDDLLIQEFEALDLSKFKVVFTPPKIFFCGGEINNTAVIPASVRQRIVNHLEDHQNPIFQSCILAESFKDYFKEGAYSDLLEFEADIANIASLVIVCLESPGSLVELGLFCMDKSLSNKLLVIAPQKQIEAKDSFIYLGPIVNLLRNDLSSVIVYPWANLDIQQYEHLELIIDDILAKLEGAKKSTIFDVKNSGHIALLIYDIIQIAAPIKLLEIELVLLALDIEIKQSQVSRLLYLLEKIQLVKFTTYSTVKYYYDAGDAQRRVKFGGRNDKVARTTKDMRMLLRQSYLLAEDQQSKKRRLALVQINEIKDAK